MMMRVVPVENTRGGVHCQCGSSELSPKQGSNTCEGEYLEYPSRADKYVVLYNTLQPSSTGTAIGFYNIFYSYRVLSYLLQQLKDG